MVEILKTAPKPAIGGQPPVGGDLLAEYEYAIDHQALAFRLSVFTQDFTPFHVLRAQDTTSSANPGTDLISLCPDRAPAVIDELLWYSTTTIQTIHNSFQTYANNFTRRRRPGSEDPPPVGGPPSPLPQIVYGWIQQHMNEVSAAVDKSASNAKDLIKDLPNSLAQKAAVEVWARGLREVAPAAQFSVRQAYTIIRPIPGLPCPEIQYGKVEPYLAISGDPILVPQNWLGDILGAVGNALIAIGNGISDLGRILKKAIQ